MKYLFLAPLLLIYGSFELFAPSIDPFEELFILNAREKYIKKIRQELEFENKQDHEMNKEIQEKLNEHISELIDVVRLKSLTGIYQKDDMENFLHAAMIAKHGISGSVAQDMDLAYSLFKIVQATTDSNAFRAIARKNLLCVY